MEKQRYFMILFLCVFIAVMTKYRATTVYLLNKVREVTLYWPKSQIVFIIFLLFLGIKRADAHIRENVLEEKGVAPAAVLDSTTRWVDGTMLHIEGKGWIKTSDTYTRFPLEFKSLVRGPVWGLSAHSAGVVLHFTASHTKFIKAKWNR